jgi:hypothetical protein
MARIISIHEYDLKPGSNPSLGAPARAHGVSGEVANLGGGATGPDPERPSGRNHIYSV